MKKNEIRPIERFHLPTKVGTNKPTYKIDGSYIRRYSTIK